MSVGKGSIKRAARVSAATSVTAPAPEVVEKVAPVKEATAKTSPKKTSEKVVTKKAPAKKETPKKEVVSASKDGFVNEVYHITEELPVHLL